ncbi:hypothetical protein BYT27DRAFT_7194939 [Phlegmacium glaucopus]|nr:hypothetical protein BYT27DRAFT_7194939 [Phlegmacium glaucopus]
MSSAFFKHIRTPRGLWKGDSFIVGIRREDPNRIWERRAPLTPDAVHKLTSLNVKFHIVPCARRVFSNIDYVKAGAILVDSLSGAQIVLGIKEPPLEDLPPHSSEQTHLMFSHTAKGQPYNTPLLERFIMNPQATSNKKYRRLIDYELLTDDDGKRTVGFGYYAGVAGVLESLSAMAHSHLENGIASPFLYTPRPHTLPSEESLRASLRSIGIAIANDGTPQGLGPFIIGLTGNGRVAQGCLSILSELPIQVIEVSHLESLVRSPTFNSKKVYLVHAKPEDYLVRIDGGQYDREHYYQSPHSYTSVFCSKIAPYLTLFLNGAGWSPSFPRLMTNEQLAVALEMARGMDGFRFTNIGDISCDVEGGLEFLTKATTLSQPFYKTRPPTLPPQLPSVQIMSVDILPTSIPLDASKSFSSALEPYLTELIGHMTTPTFDGTLPPTLERATIASKGVLAEKHKWLQLSVDEFRKIGQEEETAPDEMSSFWPKPRKTEPTTGHTRKKRILMLGSGMVAAPAVDFIAQRSDVELIIASNSLLELQQLAGPHLHVKYRVVDITRESTYLHLMHETDIVISLLPAEMHPAIARLCISFEKHLITASYVSPEMQALNQRALQSNVLLLNEIGLDPGIDHCSAADLLRNLKGQNKEIVSFTSFCGGLPAPDDSLVPLRYKFSWRPQGVLTAALNSARYLLDDKFVNVPGDQLLKSYFPNLPLPIRFQLEGLPNRDSLPYMKTYRLNLAETKTFVRGTLRYPGFSSLMQAFVTLGLLNHSGTIELLDWSMFVNQSLMLKYNITDTTLPPLSSLIPSEDLQYLHESLTWLGLAKSSSHVAIGQNQMPPLPKGRMTPLAIFAYLLSQKLKYQPHEMDMVVLSHEIITRQPDELSDNGFLTQVHTSTLLAFGYQKPNIPFQGARPSSAMARTVGLPLAIASLSVLDGKVDFRGVQRPSWPQIYRPILSQLREVGLGMRENTRTLTKSEDLAQTVANTLVTTDNITRAEDAKNRVLAPPGLCLDLESDSDWKDTDTSGGSRFNPGLNLSLPGN